MEFQIKKIGNRKEFKNSENKIGKNSFQNFKNENFKTLYKNFQSFVPFSEIKILYTPDTYA